MEGGIKDDIRAFVSRKFTLNQRPSKILRKGRNVPGAGYDYALKD
ncbi:MAG: hypothetical protein JWR15_4544 [Prosthecobacter sp.]|nr:hypothetical protein [Prosthecobacter sp.]